MIGGTQVEVDWAGLDAGGAPSGGAGNSAGPGGAGAGVGLEGGTGAGAYLSDEEILGMEPLGIAPGELNGDLHAVGARHAAPLRFDSARARSGAPGAATRDAWNAEATAATDAATRIAATDVAKIGAPGAATLAAAPMPAWLHVLSGHPQHGAEAQRLWQEHQAFRAAFSSPDEARMISDEARALRDILPGGAQEVAALREAAQEALALRETARVAAQEADALRQGAESLREAAQSVDRIDAAIFSGDARAQSEVVAEIARANPAAFRSLFAEAARVLASMGGPPSRENGVGGLGPRSTFTGVAPGAATHRSLPLRAGDAQVTNHDSRIGNYDARSAGQQSPVTGHQSQPLRAIESRLTNHPPAPQGGLDGPGPVTNHDSRLTNYDARVAGHPSPVASHQSPPFDPVAYSHFERSTNDAVARDVRSAIGDTLARVLPEGVAEGAARRIGDDIFNEVHRALAADRSLSEQVGATLRAPVASGQGWRFGAGEQQRVASLLAGRAKQLVPGVARRVIGEWTSSVLGTSRSKAARQAVAASRVDIAAAGGSADSRPLRAMSQREVNYASMSDDEILGIK